MATPVSHSVNDYVMRDQVPGKIRAIMDDALSPRRRGRGTPKAGQSCSRRGSHWDGDDEGPMLSRPGWVAVTLLVIAFNLMAVLPPAA